MIIYKEAILPLAFKASGINAGIKNNKRKDLALFYSGVPAQAAAFFTANKIVAAPLVICKKHLKGNHLYQAIVVNSGNANSFTGIAGLKDAQDMAIYTAKGLGIDKESVFVASTGIIGKKLPIERIKKAMPDLVNSLSKEGIDKAKIAIMTTDTRPKEITIKFNIGKKQITVCGIAKGAGMIAPNMATLLVFIFSDANITKAAMGKALKYAVDNSFNCITVDGCMSTNDTVIALANGMAGNILIKESKNFVLFLKVLETVCLSLAQMVVRDAEGATKFIRIKVVKAKNKQEAKLAALAIANSNLFKTAVYGENPNFGRIVSAVGACGIEVKEKDLKIKVGTLKKKEVNIEVSLGRGKSAVTVYTSDLTPEYIKINAEYN